jgi:hypothetical protein
VAVEKLTHQKNGRKHFALGSPVNDVLSFPRLFLSLQFGCLGRKGSFSTAGRQIAVELLRFLAVLPPTLPAFASFGIDKSNLLETRVVIASYNPHVRLLVRRRNRRGVVNEKSHDEGIASHIDPESCGATRKGGVPRQNLVHSQNE